MYVKHFAVHSMADPVRAVVDRDLANVLHDVPVFLKVKDATGVVINQGAEYAGSVHQSATGSIAKLAASSKLGGEHIEVRGATGEIIGAVHTYDLRLPSGALAGGRLTLGVDGTRHVPRGTAPGTVASTLSFYKHDRTLEGLPQAFAAAHASHARALAANAPSLVATGQVDATGLLGDKVAALSFSDMPMGDVVAHMERALGDEPTGMVYHQPTGTHGGAVSVDDQGYELPHPDTLREFVGAIVDMQRLDGERRLKLANALDEYEKVEYVAGLRAASDGLRAASDGLGDGPARGTEGTVPSTLRTPTAAIEPPRPGAAPTGANDARELAEKSDGGWATACGGHM